MPTRTHTPSQCRKQKLLSALGRALPLVPSMIVFAIFMLGPILYAFYGSLTNAELSGARAINPDFVGFANYLQLFSDSTLFYSVIITVLFIFASAIVGQNILGLAISLLMIKSSKWARDLIAMSVVTAWVLPEIVSAFAAYAYFSDTGTLNSFIQLLGIPGVSWLYDHPIMAITLANIWRGTAFSMLIYSAALCEVSPDILEAATVDGANEWQKTFSITIPVIKKSIATNMLLVTLQTMGVFTVIWVMTNGGPAGATTTLPVLAYEKAFKAQMIGMGTAISVVLLILGAIMSIFYIRLLKERD